MTTPARAALYLAQHLVEMEGRRIAIHNPHNKPIESLPVIYGFNNGGRRDWYEAMLLADDGTCFPGHICSHEAYMPHDLGILEGSRPDRHEKFREHYPDGYRMEFIPRDKLKDHVGLNQAIERHVANNPTPKEP